jgi:hypothetical protein
VALINRTRISMKSIDNLQLYRCTVLNPDLSKTHRDRSKFERYLARGWYTYLDEHRPKIGDVLHFLWASSREMLFVKLMRNKPCRGRFRGRYI